MIPPKGQRIIELVNQGRYWEALSVNGNTTPNELNVAHLRLLNEFREYPEIQRSLNIAKVRLRNLVKVKTDIHEPEESEGIQDTTDIEGEEILDLLDEPLCDICKLDNLTKYVELHQNIGGVFIRLHKSVKGELCKSCISKYFWRFTLITLVIGWWGVISFFVTPFFILNNIRYYISSLWHFRKNREHRSFSFENAKKAKLKSIKDKMASINFRELLRKFIVALIIIITGSGVFLSSYFLSTHCVINPILSIFIVCATLAVCGFAIYSIWLLIHNLNKLIIRIKAILDIRKWSGILIRHKWVLLIICSMLVIGGVAGLVITKGINHENNEPIQNLTEKNTQKLLPVTSQKAPVIYDSKDKVVEDNRQEVDEKENMYTEKPSLEKPVLAKEIMGKDNIPMVLIPAGEFQMGSFSYENERPIHTVYLDAFYIDVHEITNAQYKVFIDATGHKVPYYWNSLDYNALNNPVVGVSWNDAIAYAEWTNERLPTEAEWEKSARGGLTGKEYPWGYEIPNGTQCNFADKNTNYNWSDKNVDDKYQYTSPVGSFHPNCYGLYDMAGNVWEWCLDIYDLHYYAKSPKVNPTGPDSGDIRVIRGGSWANSRDFLRVANRDNHVASNVYNDVGFRCAKLASSIETPK